MKKILTNLLTNSLQDALTSLAGTVVGAPDIINGFMLHNWTMVLKGIGELIIGLATNMNK
jgi:hypothetical protein